MKDFNSADISEGKERESKSSFPEGKLKKWTDPIWQCYV